MTEGGSTKVIKFVMGERMDTLDSQRSDAEICDVSMQINLNKIKMFMLRDVKYFKPIQGNDQGELPSLTQASGSKTSLFSFA
jgi:hypothetical protein